MEFGDTYIIEFGDTFSRCTEFVTHSVRNASSLWRIEFVTLWVRDAGVLLLDSWLAMEEGLGDAGKASEVRAKRPKQIKKKRPITNEEGQTTGTIGVAVCCSVLVCVVVCCSVAMSHTQNRSSLSIHILLQKHNLNPPLPTPLYHTHAHTGWEEYFDYIFPDEAKPQALKILEMAQKWKKQKVDE